MRKEEQLELEEKYIRWFSALGKGNVKDVGGKAANLGEMYKIGMPVPQGFAVTAAGYSYFLEKTELKDKIYEILSGLDTEDTKTLDKASRTIKEMIENAKMPEELRKEILEAYDLFNFNESELEHTSLNVLRILKTAREPAFVAVRSSATAEDSKEASFAGANETFLNVKGKENLIDSVKKCWASLFTARSIYYRIKKGFKHENVLIAVIIQLMINSDKSGVIFSKDPVEKTGNVVVESVFGLGEGIVSGRIEPDHYIVDKDLKIISKKIAEKKVAIVRDSAGHTTIVKLTEERSNQQVLSDYEIKKLADYALKLEEHYKLPQDIEFAISSGEIFIVQTRPITTLGKEKAREEVKGKEILSGLAASPGIGFGEVRIIKNTEGLEKIRKGDILVTEMTNPDMVVAMQKASGIVTDEGGSTSHAAIVSREMGIACVVGTKVATKILKDGMIVSVDGFNGKIYEGNVEELKVKKIEILPIVETKTKIKVIVDLPDFAERAAKTGCKDVGLVRLEGIIAESGKHPFYFSNNPKDYEEIIYHGVKKISEYFDELWVRTSDIRSDEYRHLLGAPGKTELNPMLGMHGIRASLKNKELLKAEIKALARIKKKIGLMMPQIISAEEVKEVKKILEEMNSELKLGVMIETPAAVQIIEELCKLGISFISFGTNDLTQYTLAIDRGNEQVQYLYDEMHPAVLKQLADVISVCKKYNVETSICGQAASNEKMAEFLVKQGIDSLSVNADKAYEISKLVKELEDKGVKNTSLLEKAEKFEKKAVEEIKEIVNKVEQVFTGKEEKMLEKEKHKYSVKCSRCKKDTEVPFKPDGVRPVYCRICLEVSRQEKLAGKKEEKVFEKVEKVGEKIAGEVKEEVKEIGKEVEKAEEKIVEVIKEAGEDIVDELEEAGKEVVEDAKKIGKVVANVVEQGEQLIGIEQKKEEKIDDESEEEIEIKDDEFYEKEARKASKQSAEDIIEDSEEELDIF